MNSKNSARMLSVFFVCFLIALLVPTIGYGESVKVCKVGCTYNTLQSAVNDVQAGGVIRVQNGDYAGNLVITKPVTITGTRAEWTRISPSVQDTPVVEINTADGEVVLKNLGIVGNGQSKLISAVGATVVRLADCRLAKGEVGISLSNYSSLKAKEAEIEETDLAVEVRENSEITLTGCLLRDNVNGLLGKDDSTITMIDSTAERNTGYGLSLKNTALANVFSTTITGNGRAGIKIAKLSRLNLKESKITGNETGGILLSGSANAYLQGNEIVNNGDKNLSVISEECGFSGGQKGFYGVVTGTDNEIVPANPTTICPGNFAVVNSDQGGTYSYLFRPTTLAFIGLVGAATVYLLLGG